MWIDFLSRDLLETGELERMMRDDAVSGVTSNPTIFQKAMSEGTRYDEQLRELNHADPRDAFFALAARDVGNACDLMRSVWDGGEGLRGYVSIEVDPTLAYDTDASREQAQQLHEQIDRPNLYVKIPGTEPGLQAIEDMIAAGRSINVTLIFSLERHREVMDAYIRGHRATRRRRWRSLAGELRRELLRLAGGHRGRQAAGRARPARAEGQARRRQRQARLSQLAGDVRGRAVGAARGRGRVEAMVSLGVHVHEEPGLPRRALRGDR